jgi:hypothetical protein
MNRQVLLMLFLVQQAPTVLMSILQAPPNAMIVHLENIVRKVHQGSLGTVIQATFVLAEQVLQLHQAPSLLILTQQLIMVFAQ